MIQRLGERVADDPPRQRDHVEAVQRAPKPGSNPPAKPLEPLGEIARRIAHLALGPRQVAMGAPNGPVLTVVRDLQLGTISVGLNTGAPVRPTDLVGGRIEERRAQVRSGAITPEHTHDPGDHSEVTGWDRAVAARQRATGRPVKQADVDTFELHNVWLKESKGRYTAAPRCEHCAAITRGVKVTQSVLSAEEFERGATAGEITVPSSKGQSGGLAAGAAVFIDVLWELFEPWIKRWIIKKLGIEARWKAREQEIISQAIEMRRSEFDQLLLKRLDDVKRYQAEGRAVAIHVNVDTTWQSTELGPALMHAKVGSYELVVEDGPAPKPYAPPGPGLLLRLAFESAGHSESFESHDIPVPGTDPVAADKRARFKAIEAKMRGSAGFERLIINSLENNQPLDDLRDYAAHRRDEVQKKFPGGPGPGMEHETYWLDMERLTDAPMADIIAAARNKGIPLDLLRKSAIHRSRLDDPGSDPIKAARWAEVVALIDAK
jgi:hypothetical protein